MDQPQKTEEKDIDKKIDGKENEPIQETKIPPLSYFVIGAIVGFLLAGITGFTLSKNVLPKNPLSNSASSGSNQLAEDLPSFSEDVVLPVRWGDMGKLMVASGVIDGQAFENIYSQRGGLDESSKKLLYSADNGNLVINQQNSGFLLNLLWALGLGNKNPILDNGPMQDKQFGGAANFASTGGWTLAKGNAMNHFSKYNFINLTAEQQALVENVSKNIYRPCCGNSTYFPDCNHGMAMLGLLELAASQGKSEQDLYKIALVVSSYWFPDNYKTIAKFMQSKGVKWQDVDAKQILGINFSSSQGYNQVVSQIQPVQGNKQGGCGV